MHTIRDLEDALVRCEQPAPPLEHVLARVAAADSTAHTQRREIRSVVAVAASVIAIAVAAALISLFRGHPPATSNSTNQTTHPSSVSPTSAATTEAPHAVRYLGKVAAPSSHLGAEFAPPGQAEPTITWQQAYATCTSANTRTNPPCDNTTGPNITLALVTTPGSGDSRSDGSIIPLLDHTLAYVLTWPNEQCFPAGGPAAPGTSPAPMQPIPCAMIVIIDAHTGHPAYNASGTGP